MLKFLISRFVPNSDDTSNPEVREAYGTLGGVLGIVCNLILFAIKLTAGYAINSIAVVSDAFNNLSDMGSSLVSIIGARLSSKRADAEHPYGHGRAEYYHSCRKNSNNREKDVSFFLKFYDDIRNADR